MRLLARFVVVLVTVFGFGLAFAWAWDNSDNTAGRDAAAAQH
jgi:hypothetical protein